MLVRVELPERPAAQTRILGARLRSLRERLRWTQRGLGDEIGVSDKTVSSWETGRSTPSLTDVSRIAEAFGMSVDVVAAELLRQPPGTRTERYSTVCSELVQQLEGETPEVADAVLQAFRQTMEIVRTRRQMQNN